jgi:peptidoglycan/xylan/chitin deacetylase (PgdA/CDA1 family)
MNPPSLMYHDVVAPGHDDASGFPGPAAAHYKLDGDAFERQLTALAGSGLRFPAVTASPLAIDASCLLTFDDGGASAAHIGTLLSERRMIGHFMVTTSRIGTSGFLNADAIRDLHAAGHVIGSHSHTHPAEISRLPAAMLDAEWRISVERLQQILGRPVSVASIPGGFYSRAVAQAAAASGICFLFTSEPTVREHIVDGCLILGRYTLWRGMEPVAALALARGTGAWRQRQWLEWNLKKPLKRCARPVYHLVRRHWLGEA